MGLRSGVGGCGKISFTPEFDPRTVQPRSESLYRPRYSGLLGNVSNLYKPFEGTERERVKRGIEAPSLLLLRGKQHFTALNVLRRCPFVPLAEVGWKQGKALGLKKVACWKWTAGRMRRRKGV